MNQKTILPNELTRKIGFSSFNGTGVIDGPHHTF